MSTDLGPVGCPGGGETRGDLPLDRREAGVAAQKGEVGTPGQVEELRLAILDRPGEEAEGLLPLADRRRYAGHEPELFYVTASPHFALLHGDPRFAAIEKRIAAGIFPASPADRS